MKGKHIFNIKGEKSQDSVTIAINATQPVANRKSLGAKCLLLYNGKPAIEHQIDLIKRSFEDPEIIIITGFASKNIYSKKPDGVRIIENQLFESTRQMEDFRLVAQSTESQNIIFIPDNMMISKEDLISLSKRSSFLTSPDMLSEKIPLIENGVLSDFVYHKIGKELYYGNCFSLSGRELKMALNFCFKNVYGAYLDTEMLCDVARNGGQIHEHYSESAEFII